MFLNQNEEKIVFNLYSNLNNIGDSMVSLIWDNGSIKATFDTCFEDMDDETYEEFYSFVFIATEIIGTPPVEVLDNKYFLINYKNFPNKILCRDLTIS